MGAPSSTRIMVTGANGFVGRALCGRLSERGYTVRAAVRLADQIQSRQLEAVSVGSIGSSTNWRAALDDVQIIIHLAARVHIMRERTQDPLAVYREVNSAGTLRLAEAALAAGVRRLVYVSTVKVHGESTHGDPFSESQPASPQDAYALSKWEAEQGLMDLAAKSGLEVVIVRPPLVYGPGVKGNMQSLMRLVEREWPLPLASCVNQRSLVGLDNFTSFLTLCAEHPSAAGEMFLISDGQDLSTPELIRRLAVAMRRRARLFPVPDSVLRAIAGLFGRSDSVDRLCGSLQVVTDKARRVLGWQPSATVDEELYRTARAFLESAQPDSRRVAEK